MRQFVLYSLLSAIFMLGSVSSVAAECLVAVAIPDSLPRYQKIHNSFAKEFHDAYGDSCRIYVQTPNSDAMSLRNSIRKAVVIGADLIVTYGASATVAAKYEAHQVPVLYAGVYDPESMSEVSGKSLSGPAVGGIRGDGPAQTLLKLFAETGEISKLAIIYEHRSMEGRLQRDIVAAVAEKRGFRLVDAKVDQLQDLPQVLTSLPDDLDGIFLADTDNAGVISEQVLSYAAEYDVPVVSQLPGIAEMGAFMALEAAPEEQGELLADLAVRVISGEAFETIPVIKPRQVYFVVNVEVARQLEIKIPLQTLSVAARIVR